MRAKCISLFLLLPLLSRTALAQDPHALDSLRQAFQKEINPHKRIDIFYEIANENSLGNPQVGLLYADSLAAMARQAAYEKGRAMAFHLRGNAHLDLNKAEAALEFFRQEYHIFTQLKEPKEQSTAIGNMGNAWASLGKSDSAITCYLRSAQIDEQLGNRLDASYNYNNIGDLFSDDGLQDKAIEYFEKALNIRKELGHEKRLIQCYMNLASVYGRKNDLPRTLEYTQVGLALAEKYSKWSQAGMLCNNLGDTYTELGQPAAAIPWLQKAKQYFLQLDNVTNAVFPIVNLSEAYAASGNYQQALATAKEGYALVEQNQLDHARELYYKVFASIYEGLHQPGEAYTWYKKYVGIADSIFKQDNIRKVTEIEAQYQTQKQKAEIAQQQLQIEQQNNRQRLLLFSALALVLVLLGFFQYVRQRQRLRQKEALHALSLQQAEAEKLRELDRIKTAFFTNISHEFRTPLTLISGPVSQWLSNPHPDGQLAVPLAEAQLLRRNANRLLELVNQLLDLSKLESGRMQLAVGRDDLGRALRVLAHTFDSLAEANGIDFQVEAPESPLEAWFDRDKLEKIISNLLSNAFKHTPTGGTIHFSARVEQQTLLCSVADTGPGIAPDDADKIFERFYQVEGASDKGTGIGLALVKELVALHRGEIAVESRPGQGARFILHLPVGEAQFGPAEKTTQPVPVAAPPRQPVPAEPTASAAAAPPESAEQPLCLIVEDHRDVQEFIRDQLAGAYRILLAPNGREGFQLATEHIPDLVVSDVMMPEMDGNELCRLLKTDERTSHIPVILLTAKADQDSRLSGLETGADDYLTKPFDARELRTRAQNLVDGRRRLREQFRRDVWLQPKAIALSSADDRFLQRLTDILEERLADEQLNVEDLAHRIGLSRSQLHRKLTALTDQAPVEFIRMFRLKRAKDMLEARTGNVSEVCYDVGFSSPAYFAKAFKDAFGISPSELL
ncbi:MAG: response regulator [Saprospiraceae bacterium]|nr:response regulator [Saprospiraceae bacterium]